MLTFIGLGGVAVSTFGCGPATPCEQAVDRARSCGLDDAKLTPEGETCDTFAACVAECVVSAPCSEILANVNVYAYGPFVTCTERCGGSGNPGPPSPLDSGTTQ